MSDLPSNIETAELLKEPPFKVLIADLYPKNQKHISDAVGKIGNAEFVILENGTSALEVVRQEPQKGHPFDLVIMPSKSGMGNESSELFEAIKGTPTLMVVLASEPANIRGYFKEKDIKSGKVRIINRRSVALPRDMEELLKMERETKWKLMANNK